MIYVYPWMDTQICLPGNFHSGPPSPLVQSEPRAAVITNAAPRAGITQPTVLPPRHDQQVRPAPRVVPTPVWRPVVSGPRPALPMQLPTQPLPPENVRKAQPVLLEQDQPTKQLATVTTLSRTVSLIRTPLLFSIAHMVTYRQVPMTATSHACLRWTTPISAESLTL